MGNYANMTFEEAQEQENKDYCFSEDQTKFINNFEITIGSSTWDRANPMLSFHLNDRFVTVPLKEFKNWIDTIVESKGDRNPKAYAAFNNFKGVFVELLYPFINYQKEEKTNE